MGSLFFFIWQWWLLWTTTTIVAIVKPTNANEKKMKMKFQFYLVVERASGYKGHEKVSFGYTTKKINS